jgi:hypothetical protein
VTLPSFHEAVGVDEHPKITSIQRDFSGEALEQLRFWLEQNPPSIPITQIQGFVGFQFQAAPTLAVQEATQSASYGDLSTVGPALTNMPDGQYVIFFGAHVLAGTAAGVMSLSINGAGADDNDSIAHEGTVGSPARALVKTLKGGGNSLVAKYKSGTGGQTVGFEFRWLIAGKYANA